MEAACCSAQKKEEGVVNNKQKEVECQFMTTLLINGKFGSIYRLNEEGTTDDQFNHSLSYKF